ncbi:hypothetical protein Tco_0517508 [Tanacetum coccineum]
MLNSSTRIFSFQFSSMDGLDAMLENGLWFIPWVKLHGVPVTAFSEDGLSVIATKLDTSLLLDSYTSDMCIQSWGRSSYARALIEVRADVELKDNIVDECPKYIDSDVAKNMKKPSQTPRGVSVDPKVGFKSVKQVYKQVPKKNNVNTNGTKKNDVESTIENVESSSTSTTHIVEKINKMERLIIEGKVTLVDDEGKPLTKVDSSGDHDSEDEESYVNGDFDVDPYDDDMYEGQDIPDKIQDIYDN